MNSRKLLLALVFALTLMNTACSQLIVISPHASTTPSEGSKKVPKKVGMFISDANLAAETRHPHGGGDTVVYLPYRDLETPIFRVLQQSFQDAARLNDLNDSIITTDSLSILAIPKIETTSTSGIFGMWAPNEFSVTIRCEFLSATTRAPIVEISATGKGTARAGELMNETSLAARRATQEAIEKFRQVLLEQTEVLAQAENLR
jgi:hypothetical protein